MPNLDSLADELSCDIKLVDRADRAILGMLEVGYGRRDVETLGYFMEIMTKRLRRRYEQEVGSPYDDPELQPVRLRAVNPPASGST